MLYIIGILFTLGYLDKDERWIDVWWAAVWPLYWGMVVRKKYKDLRLTKEE